MYDNLPNKAEFNDALWLMSRKKDVSKFNNKKFSDLKTHKFQISAVDTYTNNSDRGIKADTKVLYQKIEKCGVMENQISLPIVTRVMLRRNTD